MKVSDLANLEIFNAAHIVGSSERIFSYPASIEGAMDEFAITFCEGAGNDALEALRSTAAGVIICSPSIIPADWWDETKTFIVVENPRLIFLRMVTVIFVDVPPHGIHPSAIIHKQANIHPRAHIGPLTYVGESEIGEDVIIHGHVHIYDKVKIAARVVVYAGAVIGAGAFTYVPNECGEYEPFPALGNVIIENDVAIHSQASVDRGVLDDTVVGQGTKLGKFSHVGGGTKIGRYCIITAHVTVSGRAQIGDHAWIAPGARVRDGVNIGESVLVGMGAVVTKDVPPGIVVVGVPAKPFKKT